MKKYLFILFALGLPLYSTACDICGCGVGSGYIGILPDFSKHIAGLRYRANKMTTHLGADGATTYLTTQEHYNTLEAWGGWTIGDNIRLMVAAPYSFNRKTNQGNTEAKNGLGDISAIAFYQLVNKRKTVLGARQFVQSLWAGAGVKLPTGEYNASQNNVTSNSSNLFQLGSGSYDFNLTSMYDLRFQDFGINLMGNYRMTTTNRYGYKYGNKVNVNTQLYYKRRLASKFSIAPNAGIQFERSSTDLNNGFEMPVSGGYLWIGTLGTEVVLRNVSFGANYQIPLQQKLAREIIKANNRAMVHIGYVF